MEHRHHAIDYIELPVTGLAAAREFYGTAFGWGFNDYGPAYAGIRSADGTTEVGGLNATGGAGDAEGAGAAPGGPLVLLFSQDLDASVRAVEAAGGQVVQGPYEFPGGRRFHFADPSGNQLGVWAES